MASSDNNVTADTAFQRAAERAIPDFDSGKDAAAYVRQRLDEIGEASSEAAVERFKDSLDKPSREKLLDALLMREADAVAAMRDKKSAIYELAEGYSRGEYPYKHRYPEKLYEEELFNLQVELLKLQEWVKRTGARIAIIFEGRDTAGKGGTIGRFVEHLNPRGARIVALPKPTEVESKQWYFQRYVAQLPNPGEICFFDRSWYNRCVVEPVMGFCTQEETDRFLSEVSYFEKSLVRSGITLIKFWLSISQEEQLRRFKDRQVNPLKRWKLSPVDIASIDKWDDYTRAMQAMFRASDSPEAPWTVILNEDKRRGRLNAIRVLLHSISYDGRDFEKIGAIDPLIVGRAGLLLSDTDETHFSGAMSAALASGRAHCAEELADSAKKAKKAAKKRAKRIEKLEAEVKSGIRSRFSTNLATKLSGGDKN